MASLSISNAEVERIAVAVGTAVGKSGIVRSEVMKRALGHPLFWLSLLLVVRMGLLAVGGGLDPQTSSDTASYLRAGELDTLVEILAFYRAMGYPAFLRLVASPEVWLDRVPEVQVGLYLLSLYLFWFAVERLSGSGWFAFAATLPLPWAGIMSLGRVLQPDFMASVGAVVAISGLILLVSGSSRLVGAVSVTAGVFASYQFRPAAVFLVGLVPVLALVLCWLRTGRDWRKVLRFSVGVGALTLVPFILFCSLRWVVVGHFGVVSFGGTNLAGLAASLVDRSLVRELPREHRALARRMMSRRARLGWQPMRLQSDIMEYFGQYSDNIWKVARPVALHTFRLNQEAAVARGEKRTDPRLAEVVANAMLESTSKAIIGRRPRHYYMWVRSAFVFGLRQLLDYAWIVALLLMVMLSLPIWILQQRGGAGTSRARPPARVSALVALLIVAVAYFASYLLLVSLVSFPVSRYFVSMTVFLPSAISAQLFEIWRGILTAR